MTRTERALDRMADDLRQRLWREEAKGGDAIRLDADQVAEIVELLHAASDKLHVAATRF